MDKAETGQFTSFDGTAIVYDHWPGERGPVVLHHGFAADSYVNWVRPGIVAQLVDRGFAVVAVDARPLGQAP